MPASAPLTPAAIAALIRPEAICLSLQATTRVPAICEVAAMLAGDPLIPELDTFVAKMLAREETGNTALGNGAAMPHARTDLCRGIVIAVGRSARGIDYDAPDGQPVRLVFVVGTPMQQVTEYLRVVGALARLLAQAPLRERLLAAPDAAAFLAALAG
jgi:mannitol/fructose-specific phosphotransferase system IIA component (Ntr-type)